MTPTEQDKELREAILLEFKNVHRLAPADYTENCTSVVMELITAHTNKQVEAVLDRLESMAAYDPSGSSPVINPRQIEAERNKLKESE